MDLISRYTKGEVEAATKKIRDTDNFLVNGSTEMNP
jgi:hypothetical protein